MKNIADFARHLQIIDLATPCQYLCLEVLVRVPRIFAATSLSMVDFQ
jgi:hypothetical protein